MSYGDAGAVYAFGIQVAGVYKIANEKPTTVLRWRHP